MFSYLILSSVLVFASLVFLSLSKKQNISFKYLVMTLIIMTILTAIFDNLIIYFDIVNYDDSLTLNLKSWLAPIEDYSYMIFATIASITIFAKGVK